MGKTLIEKTFARTSGRREVSAGDFVLAKPDVIWLHEGNLVKAVDLLQRNSTNRILHPEKVFLTIDHDIPGSSQFSSDRKNRERKLAKELGIKVYDIGRHGISGQLGVETGDILPGMLSLSSDIHVTSIGGIGAVSIPISRYLPVLLATGETWFRVPETIRVNLRGTMQAWMTARDVVQWLFGQISAERADYTVIEYGGPLVDSMSIDGRMTLCWGPVEIGAKTAVVPANGETAAFLKDKLAKEWQAVHSDPDCRYAETLDYSIGELEPYVSLPGRPDDVHPLDEVLGTRVDQALIGTCAGGRMEDLRIAAKILKDHRVHDDVRLLVVPASQAVYGSAASEGLLATFARAGATVLAPGCAPCYGMQAALSAGETRICTAPRNDRGRMGSFEARIFLAGPSTVTTSAIRGEVTDPREFI
ncbi:MAG: 3-isopropylmalate dehydratase large subunit [Chloroflexi bacterium]|nr:3-isopropylmalate dehydratase large subunit [Chloroflexota bacterium]